jgi:ABC-type transport system involved in multi-copper enzyme maturation permease subunit
MNESLTQTVQQYFFVPFFFLLILFIFFWFVVGILICLWVYRDAKSRGMEGALWVLIVLVANVIGLIVYLIVREERKPPSKVPTYYERQPRFCSNCGSELKPNAKFCSNCGKSIA